MKVSFLVTAQQVQNTLRKEQLMFGFILFIVVLSSVVRLFTRPFYGYYRPRIFPFGGFGGWGMGYPFGPMWHGHHHHHRHHHMGYW